MASRKRNKRNLSIGRIAMMIIVVGLLVGIGLVVKNIIGLTIEKRELLQQQSELTEKRDELATELENVNDLDYIEEQARKLLHMIKPGEILYILNGGHPKDEDGNTNIELPTQPYENNSSEGAGEENSGEGTEEYSGEEYSGEGNTEEYSGEGTTEEYSGEGYSEEYSGEENSEGGSWGIEENTEEYSGEGYEEPTGEEGDENSEG